MPETRNPSVDAAAFTAQGTPRVRVALPLDTFDGTVNLPVMHQAVKAFLANQRQGNASTKTRGEGVGGNQKPGKQKGTGRARQGSIRAPNWVGGGTVFGPRPRKYTEIVPKQGRALPRKSARNAQAVAPAAAARAPRARAPQGTHPHGRREAERVPLGPQPAARARHAVQRRLDVPHPLVGRGAGGVGRARRSDGAGEGEGTFEGESGAVREPDDRRRKTGDRRRGAGSRKRGGRKHVEVQG